MTVAIKVISDLSVITPEAWNNLIGDHVVLRHEYLRALHECGCACPATGWSPHYITMWQRDQLTGAMPLYLKSHSYGEYVFDWAWADAYHRYGEHYYPKLLSAVPFTPVSGPRLIASDKESRLRLLAEAMSLRKTLNASSVHCLFPPVNETDEMETFGMLRRVGVQFHWENHSYSDFADFLATMNHDKRKKIHQERRKLSELGVTFATVPGRDVTDAQWRFFFRCYSATYRNHGSKPYLNLAFFQRLGQTMGENVVLFMGFHEGEPVACSLCLRSTDRLLGRYWGATGYVPGLHFEMCYYRPIEYCIAKSILVFEGGAQGEHKLARGLLPVQTTSAHFLARKEFSNAVAEFLVREKQGIGQYVDELERHAPFKYDPVQKD